MLEKPAAKNEFSDSRLSSIRRGAQQGGFDAWRLLSAPFSTVVKLHSARLQSHGGIDAFVIGSLGLVSGHCGAHLVRRTQDQVSATPGFILITYYHGGRVTGMMDGDPFGAQKGDLILRDLDYGFEALRYPSTFQSILIPRRLLGIEHGKLQRLRILQSDDLIHRAVIAVMQDVFDALKMNATALSDDLMQRLLATVRKGLLHPGAGLSRRQSVRQRQMRAIEHCIERNLGRLDLSAETILPEFGLSRATLYRLFESKGGVRRYIVDRRLFRALMEISDSSTRRGKIQFAAKRWGFSSPSNFNRSVQQMFGASPGALLKEPANHDLDIKGFKQTASVNV
ncbi:MAG: AraC family transcriptional regulator [Pseudomonadota bacterium]